MVGGRRLLVFLYASSGAAALIYEVTWTRLLTLQLGHTVAAASIVLAAFMGGLACGAWLATRMRIRGLRAYAILEIVIALAAVLLPLALAATAPILAWAYADGTSPATFTLVRIAISLGLMGVPTAAMGATFPIAADCAASFGGRSRADAAVLYTANTAGAAFGAVGAGFWLIPALGLRGTTGVGVTLNLAAAAGAWWLSSRFPAGPLDVAQTQAASNPAPGPKSRNRPPRGPHASKPEPIASPAPLLACVAVAVSGFAALVYEVAWTRLVALTIGPTTYAFATMAAAFISGLAMGSAIGTRVAQRVRRPAVWMASMLAVSAVSAAGTAWYAATRLPLSVAAQVADPAATFDHVIFTQAIGILVLLLPMTLALGATFPLALAVARRGTATAGPDAARVYTANTCGAIAGALTAGFVLIPLLGLRATIEASAIFSALCAAACLASALSKPGGAEADKKRNDSRWVRALLWPAIVGLGAVGVIAAVPQWDRSLLASGAYKYAPYLGSVDFDVVLRAGTLAFYEEGPAGTVSVRQLNGTTSLAIDGKVDASNGGDMLTQRLLGLLPVLVHGNAREICVIGLGSGVTVGSALASGTVEHADVVEISPAVVRASHFFDRESGNPLANPAVRLIVGDGRSHLLHTPRQYDVIVSEPSNPWMAGVATLFTREFFEAARARLKPEGLLCQWAHTYDISGSDLRSIVRTFSSVFPEGTMWIVGGGDLLLIGAKDGPIGPRLGALGSGGRKASVGAALADVGISEGTAPFALLSQFAGGPPELVRYGAGAAIQTDDRTALEYSAPRGIYGRSRDDNAAAIRTLDNRPPLVEEAISRATDADWTSVGQMAMRAQAFGSAYDAFHRAVSLSTRNVAALSGLSDAAGGSGKLIEERDWLQALAGREPRNAEVRTELSRVRAVTGDGQGAIQAAIAAMTLAPDNPRAGEQVAAVLADAGDADRLAQFADSLATRFPDRPDPIFYQATALYLHGRYEDAIAKVRLVTAKDPAHARAQNLLGASCAALGKLDCALAAFEASIQANPRDAAGYINAGLISLQLARVSAASDFFARALTIDPASKPARDGLQQSRASMSPRS
jgi:spermidine synthase